MDKRVVNNLKTLGIDMISKANSGHPGIVLGAAPIIYALYKDHIQVKPNDPTWVNRDRFVMSAGHGSALLYANLFMAGFGITIEDLQKFRSLHSKTPGHPEVHQTPGVDMSTGPLGQGFSSAVGMAMAEKRLNALDSEKYNYNVYALCGDGDLMEGVALESAAIAGKLQLDNLIVLYDSNDITLDADFETSSSGYVLEKFYAMGWDVLYVKNGSNIKAISKAIKRAKKNLRPTLIEIKTKIGHGSLLEGSSKVHGKVLTEEDVIQLKEKLKINNTPFFIDEEAKKYFIDNIYKNSFEKYKNWKELHNNFEKTERINLMKYDYGFKAFEATRDSNYKVMQQLDSLVPNLFGGSADLSSSTKAYIENGNIFSKENYAGKNIFFGVREHAMGAIMNGLSLSGFISYGSTFLVFSDYLKPAIRLAALMNLNVVNIFTHDSIMVGEDGPTHQPIEQLGSLREIPNHFVFRPADGKELVGCWDYIINNKISASLALSRTETPLLIETLEDAVYKGGYIVHKEEGKLDAIIVATGTEVSLALKVAKAINKNIRVVSMPCVELFNKQLKKYQNEILPKTKKTIVIEASSSHIWYKYAKEENIINVSNFGVSATKEDVLAYFKLDDKAVLEKVKKLI